MSLETIEVNYKRIFLLADIHFGVRTNSLEWLDNQLDFFYNFYIPYLKKNYKKGDILFILGDWFENKELLDIKIMNKSIELVENLSKILPIYFLMGNHDIYKKIDTNINSLMSFKFIPNVTIFEQPIILTNNKNKILVLPWIGDNKKEEEIVNNNKTDYIFAHTTIAGFRYDNGRLIEKAGSNIKKVYGVKKLFSGHIHKRQEDGNAIYIGSPYHTKRSDINNQKAVYLFDPQKDSYTIEYNNKSPIFQRIKLETLLNLTLDTTKNILHNNYTDILVPDKYIHKFSLNRFIDILDNCNYKKIEIKSVTDNVEIDETNIDESNIKDILKLIESNINEFDIPNSDKKELLKLNKEFYEKALMSENIEKLETL